VGLRSFKQPRVTSRLSVATHGTHVVQRVVLHSTESPNRTGTDADVRAIPTFWGRQGAGYGAHLVIDREGNTNQGCPFQAIAWHVGGRNTGSVGIEQVAYSADSKKTWLEGIVGLKQVAKNVAYLCRTYNIPVRWDVNRGISTHGMQSLAFHTSDHTDPGPNFPRLRFMGLVHYYAVKGWLFGANA
jgi:N-acetyl-anhydromuramyl-L-alanine amidase AmpD